MKKSYIDIGHLGSDGVFVWLYNTKISAHPVTAGTHGDIWGNDAMHYWRGRYVLANHESSVIAPINYPYSGHVPQEVIEALESRFGPDIRIEAFNPFGRQE